MMIYIFSVLMDDIFLRYEKTGLSLFRSDSPQPMT